MKRYTIEPRWNRLRTTLLFGGTGLFELLVAIIKFGGSTEVNDVAQAEIAGDRIIGAIFLVMAVASGVAVLRAIQEPYEVVVWPNGSVGVGRLFGWTTVPIREVREIEWRSDRQILTITHGRRGTSISPFNHAAEIVSDVRRMNPNVVVTVRGTTDERRESNGADT